MRRERVGLLGGTFNPVHNGHIDLGLKVKEAFGLDKIRYILSAKPPHKDNVKVGEGDIRWEMLKIALKPYRDFIPCDVELKRKSYSYSIDTVRELHDMYPQENHLFIIGSDSFLFIETWKDYLKLLKLISFIVVLRNKEDRIKIEKILDGIGTKYSGEIPNKNGIDENMPMVFFYMYKSEKLSFSSTEIRQRLREGRKIDKLVNSEIIEIIKGNKLYGS